MRGCSYRMLLTYYRKKNVFLCRRHIAVRLYPKTKNVAGCLRFAACDARVLDVALKYGYTSPTAFNRAFQKVHGIPPTAAKNIGKTLHAYRRDVFLSISGGSPCGLSWQQKVVCALRASGYAYARRWRNCKVRLFYGRKQCKVRNTQSSVSYPIPVRMQSSASAYMRIPITFSTI